MKSPSETAKISNESSTKVSSTTTQVSKTSIKNNNTEQLLMTSLSDITTIINESSTKSCFQDFNYK